MKLALVLLAVLAGCPAPRGSAGPSKVRPPGDGTPDRAPRLVVLVIIDQFPEWSFEKKQPALTDGFARLLAEGEWRTGRHPSAATLTAPGHTLLGTGATPSRAGIVANEWWSREHDRVVKAVEAIDGSVTADWLRVPGLGDSIAAAKTGAKAVGVSLKNRAAILPLGHAGLAIYYEAATASWKSHGGTPAWLGKLPPVVPRLQPWTPLDPARLAQLSGVVDGQPGEVGSKGFGPTFPHDPKTTKLPADAVYAMPLGNELVLETALAAITGEQLGTDHTTDLLVVSLSAHDYVAHGWGHESWEAWDSEIRLDAQLGQFLGELDRRVGAGKWAMVLTSDHGGAPMPETLGGGRITFEQLQRAANLAASTTLGAGEWIASATYPNVYLTKSALAQNRKDLKIAMKKIIFALRSFPGLAYADRTDAYAGRCDVRTGDEQAICLTLDPERSGDFFYIPAPGWVMAEEAEPLATAHGSLNDYDRNVPVLLLPWGRTKHAPQAEPSTVMSLADVAPLLASWLGVTAPSELK